MATNEPMRRGVARAAAAVETVFGSLLEEGSLGAPEEDSAVVIVVVVVEEEEEEAPDD